MGIEKLREIEAGMPNNHAGPVVAGRGTTHWYACECGEVWPCHTAAMRNLWRAMVDVVEAAESAKAKFAALKGLAPFRDPCGQHRVMFAVDGDLIEPDGSHSYDITEDSFDALASEMAVLDQRRAALDEAIRREVGNG